MKIFRILFLLLIITFGLFLSSCSNKESSPVEPLTSINKSVTLTKWGNNPKVTIFAAGLNAPRGLKFGPDGNLYVAEAGTGGYISTSGLCDSVIAPVGPYLGGHTASIVKIDKNGVLTVVADSLPSSQDAMGDWQGVADVEFVGNTLYALLGGAGCSHGVENTPNSIIKIHHDGTWNVIADLSTFQKSHPVAHPNADDYEPDGTWYSMVFVKGDFYAVEPNHCELDRISLNGNIQRVLDFSAVYGHIVPTAIAYHGSFYIGNLNQFPTVAGSSNIFKVSRNGHSKIWAKGFSEVLGVVIDQHKRMYVLEASDADGGPIPNTGKIVKVLPSGKKETVVDSLFFPTGMTLGPDGALYVSNKGFGPPIPGFGQILRVQISKDNDHDGDDDKDAAVKEDDDF